MTSNVIEFRRPRVVLSLVETNVFTRWPCYVCGGCTEKVSILCEGEMPLGDGTYRTVRVCETCIEHGDIDERLTLYASQLEAEAGLVRDMIGRLSVPTAEEYYRRSVEHEVEYMTESGYPMPQAAIERLAEPYWTHKPSRDAWYGWLERAHGMSRADVDAAIELERAKAEFRRAKAKRAADEAADVDDDLSF